MGITKFLSIKKLVALGVASLLVVVVGGAFTFSQVKKVAPVSWGWFGDINTASGVALAGYDAVSYANGAPVQGAAAHSAQHAGVTWHFASADNLATFQADPARYLPQFGGFCSFAVSKGFTADANPEVFHMADGKLYLFDSEGVKESWLAELDDNRSRSEQNWATR